MACWVGAACTHGHMHSAHMAKWPWESPGQHRPATIPFPHGATATPLPNAPDLLFHSIATKPDSASRRNRHISPVFLRQHALAEHTQDTQHTQRTHNTHSTHTTDALAWATRGRHMSRPIHAVVPRQLPSISAPICAHSHRVRIQRGGTPPKTPSLRGTQHTAHSTAESVIIQDPVAPHC